MKSILLLSATLLLVGCARHEKQAAAVTDVQLSTFAPVATPAHDANPDPALLVKLTVYRMVLPMHAISRNEDFWKHVAEEGVVDVGTHDLLYANGLRVGVAPREDWDYFKNILEGNNVVSQMTGASGTVATNIEMPLKSTVLKQMITYFHPTNGLIGQLYERCENLMTVRFEPVPRHPGDVRVTATPLLRAERKELVYTVRDEAQQLKFIRPEYLFDMKLAVDVPLDHFLIIGTSPDADSSTSVGQNFLCQESGGQQFEQVLLISPQPFQFERKPTTGPATAANPTH
jgi:hypothetical protein